VPEDPARANVLYEQACDGGYKKACEKVQSLGRVSLIGRKNVGALDLNR
jgi:TPR repeat protein